MNRKPRQLKETDLKNQIEKLLSKSPKTRYKTIQIARKINAANPLESIQKAIDLSVAEKKIMTLGSNTYKWKQDLKEEGLTTKAAKRDNSNSNNPNNKSFDAKDNQSNGIESNDKKSSLTSDKKVVRNTDINTSDKPARNINKRVDWHTDKKPEKNTDNKRERNTDKKEESHTDKKSDGNTNKKVDKNSSKKPDRNGDRNSDKPKRTLEVKGTVDMTRSGSAYIVGSDFNDDIYIHAKNLNGAMHKDEVTVLVNLSRSSRKPEGKVISIEKRALKRVTGTIKFFDKYCVVSPEHTRYVPDIIVHFADNMDCNDEDKVIIEITSWGKGNNKSIYGKVIRIVQNLSDHDREMETILMTSGFDFDFSPEAVAESERLKVGIDPKEVKKRRDFRGITTITIDPLTAKDFDDALSYQLLDDGNIEIGVHIADVTHFVREGTPLDKDALDRSTSVYLVDRVCPMLPEKISNDLCSLNPNEDKYTFSAVFTFDEKFNLIGEWFGKTIIHSVRRFTYEEAQERIENGHGDYSDVINIMNAVALHLRKKRYAEGAISFESDEVQFILDENNEPIGLHVRERKAAHMLVEDFMLLANSKVAEYIAKKAKPEIPFVYRVHDLPNPEKLADFAQFAAEIGFKFKLDTPGQIAKSFNTLAEDVKTNVNLKLLAPLAIRTMAKAVYTTENIGHYGLGLQYYAHFTSPIRRYADVLVHRILFDNLTTDVKRVEKEVLEQKSKYISEKERKANDAERESIKYMQTVYISKFLGETFDGVVSGMIERGIFVELVDSKVEGFITFDSLSEPYSTNSTRLKAISKTSGDEIKMGQQVKVKIIAANPDQKRTDMMLVESAQ